MSESTPAPPVPEHEMLRQIGRGSHGEVWLARSVTGQYRAVKIVRRDAFADAEPFEREFEGVQRFEPVSRRHEGFIDVLQVGFGEERDFFYCVMELADATESDVVNEFDPDNYTPRTLETEMAASGPLPLLECRTLGTRLSEALEYLHDAGLVHRDVKPSNIVYVRGQPRLADIGLVSLTDDDALVGTWGYAPREGFGTPAADLFSLGKVLYELATGRDRTEFPELDNPSADWRGLNAILLRACHEDESARYTSAADLAADLANIHNPQPLPRSWRWLLKPALIAAGLAALIWLAWPPDNTTVQNHLTAHWPAEINATDMPEGAHAFFVGRIDPQNTTVAYWFRTHDSTTFRHLLNARKGATNHWGWILFRGQLDFHWQSEHGGHRSKIGSVQPGDWHHTAIVFHPAKGIHWRAYLDGQPVAEYEIPQSLSHMGTRLTLGGPGGFLGQVRHIRVYNHQLNAEEINSIFTTEKPPPTKLPAWDWLYQYSDAFDPAATNHLHQLQNVRPYREWQTPPNTYWGPVNISEPASMIYKFEFERPAAAIFLRAGIKCFDLTDEQSTGGAARGCGALSVSADGKNWISLREALNPKPLWGIKFVYADLLPAAALGTRELFVKIDLKIEGAQSDTYATAQHSWDRGRKHPPFELKVRLEKNK